MSELREADEAVFARQEAITKALAEATGLKKLDVYRHLFIGMDLDTAEILELAEEHSQSGVECAVDELENGNGALDLQTYLSASWMDGFSVAAMLFLRRREGNTR